MTTILNTILAEKNKEVAQLKTEAAVIPSMLTGKKRSFLDKLQNNEQVAIIAEFKRASPSKGDINIALEPKTQALSYREFGADAISVLTDKKFFKGSFTDLSAISEIVDVPVLCKDFIIDESQIIKAKLAGADLILLIAAALEQNRLNELYVFAIQNGLEVLIEVHNEEEVKKALQTGTKLIGVNNRDLKSFTVDIRTTEKLAPLIKKEGVFLISESGIKTENDVERVQRAGADGILVGEAFMRAENLQQLMKRMKQPLKGGRNSESENLWDYRPPNSIGRY